MHVSYVANFGGLVAEQNFYLTYPPSASAAVSPLGGVSGVVMVIGVGLAPLLLL